MSREPACFNFCFDLLVEHVMFSKICDIVLAENATLHGEYFYPRGE